MPYKREDYGLPPETAAEKVARKKGWSLYRTAPTGRGLKSYEFRSIPAGGYSKSIPAESEIEAAKALPSR